MWSGKSKSLGEALATVIVAALLGLLLLANAAAVPAPLSILDGVVGLVFLATSVWLALKQEDE